MMITMMVPLMLAIAFAVLLSVGGVGAALQPEQEEAFFEEPTDPKVLALVPGMRRSDERLYQSPRPTTRAQLEALYAHGFRILINLRDWDTKDMNSIDRSTKEVEATSFEDLELEDTKNEKLGPVAQELGFRLVEWDARELLPRIRSLGDIHRVLDSDVFAEHGRGLLFAKSISHIMAFNAMCLARGTGAPAHQVMPVFRKLGLQPSEEASALELLRHLEQHPETAPHARRQRP